MFLKLQENENDSEKYMRIINNSRIQFQFNTYLYKASLL